jgi:hypothetical protein
MGEERLQVLEMLAAGKITAGQADELLDALGDTASPRREEQVWIRGEHRELRGTQRAMTPTIKKLTEARMHGVTRTFVDEMRAAGYGDLSLDELIELRTHSVDAKFVREMRDIGLVNLSPHQLVELRMYGVDAEYIREMQDLVIDQPAHDKEHDGAEA